jgi:hypothetical protein
LLTPPAHIVVVRNGRRESRMEAARNSFDWGG